MTRPPPFAIEVGAEFARRLDDKDFEEWLTSYWAKDLSELPDVVKSDIELIQVASLDDVLDVALLPKQDRTLQVA